ncbi:GNAT family N-acetyltransferase [Streptomyces platensis]|uniref:GNAT family N-acetyltransferase n=1 Tax=Streptomyces platensis TaxID=58346 RepID=UPI0034D6D97B
MRFRTDSAAWLRRQGIDQWSKPFPPEHILASIRAGHVFMIKTSESADACATVTLDRDADDRLWSAEERAEPALYVHKLSVDRMLSGTGLGARILDWAGARAAEQGADWLRLDAWTTNPSLHRYYLNQGFQHIRTSTDPSVVSGWTAQRPAGGGSDHGLVEILDGPLNAGLNSGRATGMRIPGTR